MFGEACTFTNKEILKSNLKKAKSVWRRVVMSSLPSEYLSQGFLTYVPKHG